MKGWCPSLAMAAVTVSACTHVPRLDGAAVTSLSLAAEFIIPEGTVVPALNGARFGGVSGIVALEAGGDLLAISDDSDNSRMFRLRLSGSPPQILVTAVESIPLQKAAGAPATLDPEGIALTRGGTVLVSSEGIGNEEPRVPPAIVEYTRAGRFVRQLPVPHGFVPDERGPATTGVRANAGFESLTMAPDFSRLFTANELPLVQDGPEDAFADGQRVRLLEYVGAAGSYRPARQFAYVIAPLERPGFAVDFSVNGLVELLALNGRELLALERGYIQSQDRQQDINRIRIFRISLEGASDVSAVDSLGTAPELVPVRKTLVADLNDLTGLSPSLRSLDNFEGLAWVRHPGSRSLALLVVSDDNFNPRQTTAFLLLHPRRGQGWSSTAPAFPRR